MFQVYQDGALGVCPRLKEKSSTLKIPGAAASSKVTERLCFSRGSPETTGLTPNERTISAYATAVSSIVACSYSDGLTGSLL